MFRHLSPLILAGLSVRIPKERGSIHVFSALQSGRTFPFLSLLVLFLTLLVTVFLIPHRQQTNAQATTFPSLPDTTSNIHLGQVFNYNLTNPTTEAGSIDYVWGSNYPTQPPGVYNTKYFPFDREGAVHNLAWFQANHPDWIEYQCDKKTVAFEYGDTTDVPLDITNTAVLNYLFQTYYQPAIQQGYAGIAFDNVNLDDQNGHRCGHFDSTRNWVQQFSGVSTDPAYHTAIVSWAQWMNTQLHAINASISMNFGYDLSDPTDTNTLFQYLDIDEDEGGFSNLGNYPTDSTWTAVMQTLQSLVNQGKGLFSINEEAETFENISQAEKQWVFANYLLIKGNHTYVTITGNQQYGSIYTMPEYSAQVGSATNAMYQSQGVWMRDFTNGKAIVNPSSTRSFTISLPPNVSKDLYGNAINSVTLGAKSGIVLLGTPPSPTPTPTPVPPVSKYTIYDDALAADWVNWSTNSTINFANTSAVFQGRQSIAWTAAAWGTLNLHMKTAPDVTPYTSIHFAVQAGSANPTYSIQINAPNNNGYTEYIPIANYGGAPMVGSWKQYTIPLSDLGATGKQIGGVELQNETANANQVLYVDDIYFTGPAATSTPTFTSTSKSPDDL